MVLSAFFISTLAAGASAVMVSVGILGLMTGMAFVQAPLTNAAAGSLPGEEVGGGMGIFQGLLFLGGGTGPALIGAFLAAREAAGFSAINPLYALDAAPFSDAFLAIALVLALALLAASALRDGSTANKQDEGPGKQKAG
jgi:DHA2 family metal-tetracycline-proton antiporter-like MFS transporter/DHA2 family florfenicol/chloramphenicol resistance protein-like MFS transporter